MRHDTAYSPPTVLKMTDWYIDELRNCGNIERIREINDFLHKAARQLGTDEPIRHLMFLASRDIPAPRYESMDGEICRRKFLVVPTSMQQIVRQRGWVVCPWCNRLLISCDVPPPTSAPGAEDTKANDKPDNKRRERRRSRRPVLPVTAVEPRYV